MLSSTVFNISILLTLLASTTLALPLPVSTPRPRAYFSDTLHDMLTRDTHVSPRDIYIRKPHLGVDDINIRTSPSPEVNIRGEIAVASRKAEIISPK